LNVVFRVILFPILFVLALIASLDDHGEEIP
jgi:hypothetical protein